MGKYVNNGKVSLGTEYNAEEAAVELASLLNVPRRSDGELHPADLFVSANINPWSEKKPIRSSTQWNLTDKERAQQLYGFDVQEVFCNSAGDTIDAALANDASYEYLKPRGSAVSPIEWYRYRDFDGYNHKAEIPYKYKVQTNASGANWVEVYLNPNGEILLSQIAPTEVGDEVKDYKVALIYRLRGKTLMDGVISDYTISDIEAGEQPILRYTLTTAGTYDMVFAITNATSLNEDDANWFYLPESVFEATYNPSATEFEFKFGYAEDNGLIAMANNGSAITDTNVVVRHVKIQLKLNPTKAMEGTLEIQFGEIEDSEIYASYTYTKSFSANADEDYLFNYTKTNISFAYPYIDKIYVQGILTFKRAGAETTYTRYIDFVSGDKQENLTLSASPVAFVTLKDILDKWQW